MGVRSKVLTLPKEVRAELDKRLSEGYFTGYRRLETWLRGQGFEISRGSLQRYGSEFERRVANLKRATEQAKSIVESASDREASLNDALLQLVQSRLFDVLVECEVDNAQLARFARAIAELGRAAVVQKRWAEEMRKQLDVAGRKVDSIAEHGGLSEEAAAAIRAALLDIKVPASL